jgi:hypothetical protein
MDLLYRRRYDLVRIGSVSHQRHMGVRREAGNPGSLIEQIGLVRRITQTIDLSTARWDGFVQPPRKHVPHGIEWKLFWGRVGGVTVGRHVMYRCLEWRWALGCYILHLHRSLEN